MTHARLMLPFPGSVNGLWRCVGGRNILSKRGRAYQKLAADYLMTQKPLPRYTSPVSVTARLGPPDKRRRDLDNHWKACGDALVKAGVLEDDSLIHRLVLLWDSGQEVADAGGVVVSIEPAGGTA